MSGEFPELEALAAGLEPLAANVTTGDDCERALLSIAVSLKRIADMAQCPHGEPLSVRCMDCDREHREATA